MEKLRIEILRQEHWTRAPDHWYGHFGSKKCFWKFVKSVQSIEIRLILCTSQIVLKVRKFVKILENVGSDVRGPNH